MPAPTAPIQPPVTASPIQAMPVTARANSVPEDMFSSVERSAPVAPMAQAAPIAQRVVPPLPEQRPPVIHYVLIAIGAVVGLGVVAGLIWFFAIRRPAQQVIESLPVVAPLATSTNTVFAPIDEPIPTAPIYTDVEAIPSIPVVTSPNSEIPLPTSVFDSANVTDSPSNVTSSPSNAQIVAVTSTEATTSTPAQSPIVDGDSDGLSDSRETELGTNPMMADTDGDSLSDGDEVIKYHTNPLRPDTDGDGFPDGVEVQKGYNPLGPDRCAKPDCTV